METVSKEGRNMESPTSLHTTGVSSECRGRHCAPTNCLVGEGAEVWLATVEWDIPVITGHFHLNLLRIRRHVHTRASPLRAGPASRHAVPITNFHQAYRSVVWSARLWVAGEFVVDNGFHCRDYRFKVGEWVCGDIAGAGSCEGCSNVGEAGE